MSYKGLKILAIVPARSGSKGIPRKNLYPILGKSLIEYVGEIVYKSQLIDRTLLSTDSDEIAVEGRRFGLDAPFLRPEELSNDTASAFGTLKHAWEQAELYYKEEFAVGVLLEPTSPMRTVLDVENTIKVLIDNKQDSVWTVSEVDNKFHPLKQLILQESQLDYYSEEGSSITARQQLKSTYYRNGVAYALNRDCVFDQQSLLGRKRMAYVLRGEYINIDTPYDLKLAEFLISSKKKFK